MKEVLQPDHIPKNNFVLAVPGMPRFYFTAMTGVEEELDNVVLPDRTSVSGGHTKTIEFEVKLPMHHTAEQDAMEGWYLSSQEPVNPNYKKDATAIYTSISNLVVRSYLLRGIYPTKRKIDDCEMANEGEENEVTWTIKGDGVTPL